MSLLESLYPGDRLIAGLLVVAVTIAVISTAAIVLSRRLKSHAALRHLVLFSALSCNLAAPVFAGVSLGSGIAFFSWPVFSADRSIAAIDQTQRKADSDFPASNGTPMVDGPGLSAGSRSLGGAPAANQPNRPSTARLAEHRPEQPQPRREEANVPAVRLNHARQIATLASLIWLAGTALLLVGAGRSWWLVRCIVTTVREAADNRLPGALDRARALVGLSWQPRVGISSGVVAPAVAGWFRPIVILPESSLPALSRAQLEDVLVHELAHIARRDCLVMPLQLLARALFWPIVTVHLLNRDLICAREEVCDNFVLTTRDPVEYGATLLYLAQLGRGVCPLAGTTGILHWRGRLERRIESLLNPGRDNKTRTGRLNRLLIFGCFMIVSGLLCGARIVANQRPAVVSAKPDQNSQGLLIGGRVLLPDGRPAANARVEIELHHFEGRQKGIIFPPEEWQSLAVVTSDAEGRFSRSVERNWKADDRSPISVTATLPGYGFSFPATFNPSRNHPVELKLVEDEAVRGRVIDLQGRPVAGARLDVRRMCCSTHRLVDRWLAALPPNPVFSGYGSVKDDEAPFMYGIGGRTPHFPGDICAPSLALVPVTTTDADGRFEIHGLGRDRLIFFKLTRPSIATSEVRVLTRPGAPLRFDHVMGQGQDVIYGPTLEYAAAPGITLEGTVSDEDSASPLAGVVTEYQPAQGVWGGADRFLAATTDDQGHYRIEGIATSGSNSLRVEPPGPYLEADGLSLPKPRGLERVRRDVKLKRGVWAVGRAFDLKTNEPVRGTLYYTPFRSNENAKRYARYQSRTSGQITRVPLGETDADGRFRIPIIPGRGVVCLKTSSGHFRPGFGVAKIKELVNAKPVRRKPSDEPTYDTVWPVWLSAIREVDAKAGAAQVEVDLPVDPGQDVTLKFVDGAGKGLSGIDTYRLAYDGWRGHTDTDTAVVPATSPDETRIVWFKHVASGLTKSLRFTPKPGETKRTVTLKPPAVIVGQLVDRKRHPVKDQRLNWWLPDTPVNANPLTLTDADGRFRFEVPGGEPVRLVAAGAATFWNPIRELLEVNSGEEIDLGTIVFDYNPKTNSLELEAKPERRTLAGKKATFSGQ